MDARADHDAGLPDGTECRRYELPDRREDDRGVELLRRRLVGAPRPLRSEPPRERLSLRISWACEREHAAPLVERDLDDDVRRRTEAVQAEALGVARECERAVADQAGAEQRRELEVGRSLGKREAEALVRHGELGVAAVPVVAGELRVIAEVLEACAAIAAGAVRRPQPRDADAPLLTDDVGDDHVARDERQLRACELAVDDMQVGPANGAGADAQ